MTTTENIQHFTDCLFDANDILEIRILPACSSEWCKASELSSNATELREQNQAGQNIYIGANPRKHNGGTTFCDIALARSLFVDFDHTDYETVKKDLEGKEFPAPTLITNSGHGIHCYWRLVEPIKDLSSWTQLQKRLIVTLDFDKAIHDPARIMRLPGFSNLKPPVALSEVLSAEPTRIYDIRDLEENLYGEILEEPAPTENKPVVTPNLVVPNIEGRASNYAAAWPGEPEGLRNQKAYIHSAQLVNDFSLSIEDAWPLLEQWNLKNTPPLPETELRSI